MISFSRYINIISGVGAGAGVRTRELILRILTASTNIPPGIVAEFSNPEAVQAYFGANSPEYTRALLYFSFVSKSTKSPRKISFSRWVVSAIAAMIVGDSTTKSLSQFSSITNGLVSLNINGAVISVSNIDLSTATDLTNVASIIQTALRANASPDLTTCTVQFDTNTNQFIFTGSVVGSGTITAVSGGVGNISNSLGWTTSGTVNVRGQAPATPAQAVAASAGVSSNFGSFLFEPKLASEDSDDVDAIAATALWNHAQNNKYMFLQSVTTATMAAVYAACKGYSGMAITVSPAVASYDMSDQCPAEILAATDYNTVNATQNYMFYSFGSRVVSVSDDTVADACDLNRANYIGVTETGGQQLAFYQRGVLCGDATAAVDMNTYANEMWLKDNIGTSMMELLLNSPQVSANADGRAALLSVLQTSVGVAKDNGCISAGKTLSNTQKQYITRVTGSDTAWRQVQDSGAYYDLTFTSEVTQDGRTEWTANYLLVYGKDDSIRKVNGTNTLI